MTAPNPVPAMFTDLNSALDKGLSQAGEGNLWLEPDAAQNAARACAQLLSALKSAKRNDHLAAKVDGIGEFVQDVDYRENRLKKKADGADERSLDWILAKHIEAVSKLRDLYIKAGKAYADAEIDNKKDFSSVDLDHIQFRKKSVNPNNSTPGAHLVVTNADVNSA
ncbi:hypothetical protein AAFP30_22170 [Gordonia sp. CPCC 205515]|uniref:hypothetical protein n=1 Tax=Gordonia sp. CPCC 205515 TaxID=3140791 RepID=UPI003AF3FF21